MYEFSLKDLYLGLLLGFIIGILASMAFQNVIDFGAFAEEQNLIIVKIYDGIGIGEALK